MNKNKALLISSYFNKMFRSLPAACKFPDKLTYDKTAKFYRHGPGNEADMMNKPGIVVGYHKFIADIFDDGLDYDLYQKYLKKIYYLDKKAPKCHINSFDWSGKALLDTPVITVERDVAFDGMDVWNYFKVARVVKGAHSALLHQYAQVVDDVESVIPHCFTFGQFNLLFSMFRNMVFKSPEDEFHILDIEKFTSHVFVGELSCS